MPSASGALILTYAFFPAGIDAGKFKVTLAQLAYVTTETFKPEARSLPYFPSGAPVRLSSLVTEAGARLLEVFGVADVACCDAQTACEESTAITSKAATLSALSFGMR